MGQASRRAWRLIQDKPCKVYYPHYVGLMEHQAVELVGLKQQAAGLLYGEETGGLSTLSSGGGGGSLLAELAAEMGQDKEISDLKSLFARHASTSDPTESAWFTSEASEEGALILADETDLVAAEAVEPVSIAATPEPEAPTPLTSTEPPKRRKPQTGAGQTLDIFSLLAEAPRAASPQTHEEWSPLPDSVQQLSLF